VQKRYRDEADERGEQQLPRLYHSPAEYRNRFLIDFMEAMKEMVKKRGP
jgi:hypothetical protein